MSDRQHDRSKVIALEKIQWRPGGEIQNWLFVEATLDGQWLFMDEYDERDSSAPHKFVQEFQDSLPRPISSIQVLHGLPSEPLVQIAPRKGIEVRYPSIWSQETRRLIIAVPTRELRALGPEKRGRWVRRRKSSPAHVLGF